METFWSQVLAQTPVIGVLLFALWVLWKKIEKVYEEAAIERGRLIDIALDLKTRTKIIEKTATGEISPTIARRSDLT